MAWRFFINLFITIIAAVTMKYIYSVEDLKWEHEEVVCKL